MVNEIGFVGLGIMGRPMAKNLIKHGCSLMVNDISLEAVKELTRAGAKAGTLSEIGASCEIVFISLPNGKIVQEVLFNENALSSSLRPGSLVIDTSSVTPDDAHTCENRLKEKGVSFIDAPVSGGEPKAIDGTLAIMAGGKPEDFDRALPYFKMIGGSATLIGECGSGSIAKLANQIIVNLNIAAVSEALVLAAKAGADPRKVFEAIRGGLAGSAVLDAKAPMMMDRNFKPGGKISINLKDIKNVTKTAQEIDVPLPFTSLLLEVMLALKVSGHLEEDHSAIVKFFEGLANVQLGKQSES